MPVRVAEAQWCDTLKEGQGTVKLGSGIFEGSYSYFSRFNGGRGTNPEELLGAAHAGCFSMALSAGLSQDGYAPKRIHTTARVHLDPQAEGFAITRIELNTEAEVPNIDSRRFQEYATKAKEGCPVSKALTGTEIELHASLLTAV